MQLTWHFENGKKTEQWLRGGLVMKSIFVDYTQVVNEETGASFRFESEQHRLSRRGITLWESGTAETHKLGDLVGITLEGIRRFPTIELKRCPDGVRAELPGNGTVVMIPDCGDVYYEKFGDSEPLAHRFMRWISGGGWEWVCDLM
jgi:hypothetical protein